MIIIVLIFKAELDGQVKRPIKAGVDLIVLRFGMEARKILRKRIGP